MCDGLPGPLQGGGPGAVAAGPAGNAPGNVAARGLAGNVSGSGNNYGGNSVNNYGSGNYSKGYRERMSPKHIAVPVHGKSCQ
jgi:hypothetical protein